MSYIIICKSCNDCGGDIAFLITEEKPTQEQISEVISEFVSEIEDGVNYLENK